MVKLVVFWDFVFDYGKNIVCSIGYIFEVFLVLENLKNVFNYFEVFNLVKFLK